MEPFKINTEDEKLSTVSRTIRMKASTFDRICELNLKTGVSFNKIVNQCIEYALEGRCQYWRRPCIFPLLVLVYDRPVGFWTPRAINV